MAGKLPKIGLRLIPASLADIADPSPALRRGVTDGYGCAKQGLAELAEILAIMGAGSRPPPWADWWALADTDAIVGLCGFKAAPDAAGATEIAYGSFPRLEGRGVATAMAAGLITIAARHGALAVTAHTLLPDNASATVLRRNGFSLIGTVIDLEDGEVWAWRRPFG